MGGEGQEEESYNARDGEEIMVEVVGSDVFVDGVSGDGDGDGLGKEGLPGRGMESFGNDNVLERETVSREVGDVRGQVREEGRTGTGADEEVVGVSDERADGAVGMEGVEVVQPSTSEETHVVAKRVEVTLTQKGEEKREDAESADEGNGKIGGSVQGGVLDDDAWNPGIDAVAESSSLRHEQEGGQRDFAAEEGAAKVHLSGKDEIPGVENRLLVEMNQTISEGSTEVHTNNASSGFPSHPTDAALEGNVGAVCTEDSSRLPIGITGATVADQNLHNQHMKDDPAGKTNANQEILGADSPSSLKQLTDSSGCEVAFVDPVVSSTSNGDILNSAPVNSSGGDGGEGTDSGSSNRNLSPDQSVVHHPNISSSLSGDHLPSSGEVLDSEPRFTSGPIVDLVIGEREAELKPMSDLVVGTEPKDVGRETLVIEQLDSLARTEGKSGAEPEACGDRTGNLDVREHKVEDSAISNVVLGSQPSYAIIETQVVKQEEDPVGNSGGSGVEPEACVDNEHEDRSHSKHLPSLKQEATNRSDSDVHAIPESSCEPSSLVERGEWIAMDIDEVLDLKDESTGLGASVGNLSSPVNAENISGQQMGSTDQVDIAEFHISDVKTDAKASHVPEEPVQSEFKQSKEHQQVATGDTEVIAGIEGEDIREVLLDGNVSLLENEKLDIGGGHEEEVPEGENMESSEEHICLLSPMQLVEPQGAREVPSCDSVDGRNSDIAEGNDVRDEKMDVFIGEDASFVGIDTNGGASASIQDEKQNDAGILDEAPMHEVDLDHTNDKFPDDKVSNGGADNFPISDVQASAGSESATDFSGFGNKGNLTNPLPDGVQSSNVSGCGEDKSVMRGYQTVETSVFKIATSAESLDQVTGREDECCTSDDHNVLQAVVPEESVEDQHIVGVDERNDYGGLVNNGEQEMVIEEQASETDQSKILEKEMLEPSSSLRIHQSAYLVPPENEGEFATYDLVWGKVRSHPWWPGQIFDLADASDKAVKYYKKDCFLVAYFGDRTFAWNDASVLKPFRSHFSQIEKQSNSETFQNAVNSALDEVSRRVVLGLSCSCIPREAYERIECQIVENTGIREESSRRYGVDKSSGATSFEPDKLLQHIRLLAQSPISVADRLDLVLAKAQLSAFCRFKGYRPPPMLVSEEESLKNGGGTSELSDELDHTLSVTVDGEQVPSNTSSCLKRKLSLKDSLQPKKKERSLSELMGDMAYSPDDEDDLDGKALSKSISTSSGKKRKAGDPVTDGSDRRISIYAAKVSTTSSSPKPSFKVGECIRRIASQLTGSASILKGNDQQGSDASLHISENPQKGSMLFPTDISLEEMLSQLQLAARDPKKGYSFLNNIILFFSVFRNSVVTKQACGRPGSGRKRKTSNPAGGSTEEFEFDDVNDSYWTDRIVHNYSEEQLLQNGENGDGDYPLVASDPEKIQKPSRRSYSRKQYFNGNYETSAEETAQDIERRKLSPAELVLTFAEGDSLPSEINLNKMFRRFGALKESETEVDQESHRARVVFKRGADAEVAHSSAGTFKIFGPKLVSYQLSYSPSTTFRALPLLITQGQEDAP